MLGLCLALADAYVHPTKQTYVSVFKALHSIPDYTTYSPYLDSRYIRRCMAPHTRYLLSSSLGKSVSYYGYTGYSSYNKFSCYAVEYMIRLSEYFEDRGKISESECFQVLTKLQDKYDINSVEENVPYQYLPSMLYN